MSCPTQTRPTGGAQCLGFSSLSSQCRRSQKRSPSTKSFTDSGICKCVEVTRSGPSRSSAGVTRPIRSAQSRGNVCVYSQLSGLEDVVFNDFIKDDFIPEGDGQVTSGSASLPDTVAWETDDQRLTREQNEGEALGDYKCDAGVSVENVPVVTNIKTLNGLFIARNFSSGWTTRVVKRVEKMSVAGQLAVKYKSETLLLDSKIKQGRLRGCQVLGTSCCCKRVDTVEK